jgi:hypothetical protein
VIPMPITSAGRRCFCVVALIAAALLTTTNRASAGGPLFGFFNSRLAYDPAEYLQNSAVQPAYYWSVSKFDRANAGAYGPYTPQAYLPGNCVTTPAGPQNDDSGYAPVPPCVVPSFRYRR